MPNLISRLFESSIDSENIYTTLALGAIGGVLLPEISSFLSWFRLHFLSTSKLHRYNHVASTSGAKYNNKAWALVTGASDGIGYGFVQELAANGFNVILHGRNPTKIEGLIKGLKQEHPNLSFEPFICNATDRSAWPKLDSLALSLNERKIPLTILVNNVGGNPIIGKTFTPLSEYTADELTALVDMNATFPAQITRSLLPVLVKNKPSLILNMSSVTGTELVIIPCLTGYASGKAFDRQFSRTLNLEMATLGHPEVQVVSIVTGRVQSAGMKTPTNMFVPSSRQFAASTLRMAGCGRDEIFGYWAHSLQLWGMSMTPLWMRKKLLMDIGKAEKRDMEAREKKAG